MCSRYVLGSLRIKISLRKVCVHQISKCSNTRYVFGVCVQKICFQRMCSHKYVFKICVEICVETNMFWSYVFRYVLGNYVLEICVQICVGKVVFWRYVFRYVLGSYVLEVCVQICIDKVMFWRYVFRYVLETLCFGGIFGTCNVFKVCVGNCKICFEGMCSYYNICFRVYVFNVRVENMYVCIQSFLVILELLVLVINLERVN